MEGVEEKECGECGVRVGWCVGCVCGVCWGCVWGVCGIFERVKSLGRLCRMYVWGVGPGGNTWEMCVCGVCEKCVCRCVWERRDNKLSPHNKHITTCHQISVTEAPPLTSQVSVEIAPPPPPSKRLALHHISSPIMEMQV